MRVYVAGGKYTVVMEGDGKLHALRYGEPWRDCVGDGLILALAQEIESLREVQAKSCDAVPKLVFGALDEEGERAADSEMVLNKIR